MEVNTQPFVTLDVAFGLSEAESIKEIEGIESNCDRYLEKLTDRIVEFEASFCVYDMY